MNKEKLIKQIFAGKVADILGLEKTVELLKEATDDINAAHWDVHVPDFVLPSNMQFTTGSDFDDTSVEAFSKNNANIRWVIFKVNSTWYAMEQSKIEGEWVENWTKQLNDNLQEAKMYSEQELWAHYSNLDIPIIGSDSLLDQIKQIVGEDYSTSERIEDIKKLLSDAHQQ